MRLHASSIEDLKSFDLEPLADLRVARLTCPSHPQCKDLFLREGGAYMYQDGCKILLSGRGDN
jgi:hypothetical protein